MAKYENWFKDKERLNRLIDELNRIRNQVPSVHNDSIPVGESAEMWEAMNALEKAIYFLKPLRKYKNPCQTRSQSNDCQNQKSSPSAPCRYWMVLRLFRSYAIPSNC